jgi:hypothetical protein
VRAFRARRLTSKSREPGAIQCASPIASASVSLCMPWGLRKAGKQIVRTSTRRRIRGVMEIWNSTGAVSSTGIRIRLPYPDPAPQGSGRTVCIGSQFAPLRSHSASAGRHHDYALAPRHDQRYHYLQTIAWRAGLVRLIGPGDRVK